MDSVTLPSSGGLVGEERASAWRGVDAVRTRVETLITARVVCVERKSGVPTGGVNGTENEVVGECRSLTEEGRRLRRTRNGKKPGWVWGRRGSFGVGAGVGEGVARRGVGAGAGADRGEKRWESGVEEMGWRWKGVRRWVRVSSVEQRGRQCWSGGPRSTVSRHRREGEAYGDGL